MRCKNILKEQYIDTRKEFAGQKEQKPQQKNPNLTNSIKQASKWNLDGIVLITLKWTILEIIACKGGKNLLASYYSSVG